MQLGPQPLAAGRVVQRRDARLPRGLAHDGPPPAHERDPVPGLRVLQGPQARRAEVPQHVRLRDAGGVARDEDHADGHAGGLERVAAQAHGRGAVHEHPEGVAEGGVRDQPLARVPVRGPGDVARAVRDGEVVQVHQLRAGVGAGVGGGNTGNDSTRAVWMASPGVSMVSPGVSMASPGVSMVSEGKEGGEDRPGRGVGEGTRG